MRHTLHKIEEVKWLNEKTNNVEVWYDVGFTNVDGWPVVGHFDTEIEAEEYLIQQIKIRHSFKVK